MITPISTTRLQLVALTRESATAALRIHNSPAARQHFASLLANATIPTDWPPVDWADVQEMMASKLATSTPSTTGWHAWGGTWYIVARAGVVAPNATLIGTAGATRWGDAGELNFGYGLLPAYFGRGLASEAAVALIEFIMSRPNVDRVIATTFERHYASVKILTRCKFVCVGVDPNDAQADERDRQGRGQLMRFVRETHRA